MLAWLAPLLVLGLVVFVHELGHFLAAKALGVYAPRFSLGWGPAILRWRKKGSETEYVISALPIGGYVRMASREDESAQILEGGGEAVKEGAEKDPRWDPDAMVPHGPHPVPANRWFESKPTWARVVILLAGVTMNVLLTLSVATGIFAVKGRSYYQPVIDSLMAGMPAEKAGFKGGDSVVAVNGAPVRMWNDVVEKISASAGQTMQVDVMRAGSRVTLTVVPDADKVTDSTSLAAPRTGKIGAWVRTTNPGHDAVSLGEAALAGWSYTWTQAGAVLGVLKGLFRGSVSVKQLGGPIAIATASVAAARDGAESLFALIAFLSINLAVLNLLPIPILDGGQVLLTVAEGIRGKPVSMRIRENLMKVGLALIALLFVTVMFNDIKGLATRFFG